MCLVEDGMVGLGEVWVLEAFSCGEDVLFLVDFRSKVFLKEKGIGYDLLGGTEAICVIILT